MKKKPFSAFATLLVLLTLSAPVFASEEGGLMHSNVNIRDVAAAQRGAKLFANYCLSCHSAEYMRYNRLAEDLGLGEDVVLRHLVFSDAKIGDTMKIAMRPKDAEEWLGKIPPDLSVIGRSRGADWLFTYFMTFYRDDSGGWNNLALANASMPHVLWQLQGIQEAEYAEQEGHKVVERLVLAEPGQQAPEEYEDTVRDLVTFLIYLSEPAQLKRKSIGIWVLLYLVLFALVAYALKAEYWRDVH